MIAGAHKCTHTCKETFLAELIKKENPQAFVWCFSDRPGSVRRGGLSKMEKVMRSLHTDRLVLLPRISRKVRECLDNGTGLVVEEKSAKFSTIMKKMHAILI